MFEMPTAVKAGVFHHIMRANRSLARDRQTIAFHKIFGQAFPITIPLMLFGKDNGIALLRIGRGDLARWCQHISNWGAILVE